MFISRDQNKTLANQGLCSRSGEGRRAKEAGWPEDLVLQPEERPANLRKPVLGAWIATPRGACRAGGSAFTSSSPSRMTGKGRCLKLQPWHLYLCGHTVPGCSRGLKWADRWQLGARHLTLVTLKMSFTSTEEIRTLATLEEKKGVQLGN